MYTFVHCDLIRLHRKMKSTCLWYECVKLSEPRKFGLVNSVNIVSVSPFWNIVSTLTNFETNSFLSEFRRCLLCRTANRKLQELSSLVQNVWKSTTCTQSPNPLKTEQTLPRYILEESNFNFRYVRLWDLHIPREKWLNYLQTVETLIRRRVLRRLIWVCTVCQLPFYGSPDTDRLNCGEFGSKSRLNKLTQTFPWRLVLKHVIRIFTQKLHKE